MSQTRRPLVLALVGVVALRLVSAAVITHPGYTDAHYYFLTAERLARGDGLTADFVFNFLEAPGFAPLPIASHRFWMPLATALQAAGIAAAGAIVGAFRAAQGVMVLVSLVIPLATYLVARRLGGSGAVAAVAAFVAGAGAAYAPGWPSLDNFAPVAVLATSLFATLDGVARGRPREIVLCGACLGGLLLARADGAVYVLAPLVVARAQPTAALAAIGVGALVALPWYARNVLLGIPEGQLARTALILHYEDFFRIAPPDAAAYVAALDQALAAKLRALVVNASTFLLVTLVLVGPLALWAAWRRRAHPVARAWLITALALYLAQSLVFTLHSTQGAYSHSFAGLFPTAVALAAVEGAVLLRARGLAAPRLAGVGIVAAALVLSASTVAVWLDTFRAPARAAAAASGLVQTPVLVIDAAGWRPLVDGPTLVTPADGPEVAREVARRYGARTVVLEAAHFSAYDDLYRERARADWLELAGSFDGVRVYRVVRP